MGDTDRTLLKKQQASALLGLNPVDHVAAIAEAHSSVAVFFDKAADDGMASTTTAETYTGAFVPRAAKVKSITFVPTTGGVTASDTDYGTATIKARDSGGANPVTVGALTTQTTGVAGGSGNLVQGAGKALVLTQANIVLAAGATFTLTIAKTGNGVVMRAGRFTVDLEWI